MTMFERNPMALVFSPFSPINGSCGAAWIGGAVASVELVDATNPRFREAAESGIGWTEDPAKDAGLLRVGHAHELDLLLVPALVNESPLRPPTRLTRGYASRICRCRAICVLLSP
jgi:hypothetical protein